MNAWVYMLLCADGSYYVGSARGSLDHRIGQHQSGETGGYTSKRRPVTLVWSLDFQFITDAIAFERKLKGWSRAKKEALIRGEYDKLPELAARGFKPAALRASSFETPCRSKSGKAPQDEARDSISERKIAAKEGSHPEEARPIRNRAVSKNESTITKPMTHISLVVARARNGVIGNRGAIPWRIAEDMRRFKAITMGKPLIMGRKTWDSLPKKPLPGRTNIVVTRDAAFAAEGAIVARSVDAALARAVSENPSEIMIIGGAEIYAAALPRATRIHLTEVDGDFAGDAFMPAFDPAIWRELDRDAHKTPEGLDYAYVTLERR